MLNYILDILNLRYSYDPKEWKMGIDEDGNQIACGRVQIEFIVAMPEETPEVGQQQLIIQNTIKEVLNIAASAEDSDGNTGTF